MRRRELETLELAWARAGDGMGGLVSIRGEPGMGKSHLVECFVERRREEGHPIHLGQCWEAGGAPPYWPWTQALRSLVRTVDVEGLRDRLGQRAGFLRAVLPELAGSAFDDARADEPERASFAVFDAVGELLSEAALVSTVCVVLEDLHAADEGSLLLLEFLARTTPALVIGTYREREAARRERGPTLARIARRGTLVDLAPLDERGIAELLRAAWGEEPDANLVAKIARASEGNPLFVTELARRRQLGGVESSIERIAIPSGVEATVAEHLDELGAGARELLEVASVVGRDFELGMLASVSGCENEACADLVDEAVKAELLHATSPGAYRFAHFMHRAVLYQGIPLQRRCGLHLRVAERLEAASTATKPWSTLAHHYFEAGHLARDRAITTAIQAACAASRRRAFRDAITLYRRACRVIDDGRLDVGGARHVEALLGLAQAELHAGEVEAGRRSCEVVIGLARERRDPLTLARAVSIYGSVFVLGVVDPRLVALLEEALAGLEDEHVQLRAQLLARHAAALQPATDPRRPIELAREAIALARESNDAPTLLATIRNAVSAMMDLGDPRERILLNEEHIALAMEIAEPFEAMRGHLRSIMDALELPDRVRADEHLEVMSRIADELASPHYQALAHGVRAMRARMEGRFKTAGRETERMRHQVEHLRPRDRTLDLILALHELGALRGEGRHEAVLERLDGMPDVLPEGWGVLFARALRAATLVRLGRIDEAKALLVPAEVRTALRGDEPMTLGWIAEVAAATGDRSICARILGVLEPRRGRCFSWGVLGLGWDGPVDRVLGMLEACLGRTEAARASFEAAIELCLQLDASVHLELTRADRNSALGSEGEDVPARVAITFTAKEPAKVALRREGEAWRLVGREPPIFLKDTRGIAMLARLLAEPGRELHVLELSGSAGAPRTDAGPVLDDRARTEYRRRAESLRAELAEAEAWNDTARAERARTELEVLSRELARAVGLGGRDRPTHSTVERARVNVQRRIRDAIRRIAEQDESIGRRLSRSVRTGTYCAYEPD
jgi:hypothetical protein